jgi:hypothetical protein
VQAVDQWSAIEAGLGAHWDEAKLSFVAEDAGAVAESAAILAPMGPGKAGSELHFHVLRRGSGPEKLRNLLGRLDRKRIWGSLTLVDSRLEIRAARVADAEGLAESWDGELAKLAPGWRDLLCELELDSTDYLARAALHGAPLNPTRNPNAIAFRFRVSAGIGYGTSPGMVRRCLERMDAEGITGRLSVLNALSDTENVGTQGPVWRVAGRSV